MMLISFLSSHVALVAVTGGTMSAIFNTGIEDLLSPLIDQDSTLDIRVNFSKCLVSGLTVGLLLSIVYYAFAQYAFPDKEMTPIQLIALFTLVFGLVYPLLSVLLQLLHSKLFTSHDP